MKKIAFICGAPRSGTGLLKNLLDSHPGVFMNYIETKFLMDWNYHKAQGSVERYFSRDFLNTEPALLFTSKTARMEDTERVNLQVTCANS